MPPAAAVTVATGGAASGGPSVEATVPQRMLRAASWVPVLVAAAVLGACGADGADPTPGTAPTGAATTAGATSATTAATAATPTTSELSPADPDAPDATGEAAGTGTARYPDVLEARLERSGDGWTVAATISSPYDSEERYADAFRVVAPDGTVLGVRELLHPHAEEQPFTRSLSGIDIPADVDAVVVEGRDLIHGWGGRTVTIEVPEG